MAAIGVASAGGHASASRRRSRLAYERARVRASEAAEARASNTSSASPRPAARAATVAPTGPPPMMATSSMASAAEDRFLHVLHAFRASRGEDVAALRRHQHVVLDAHADVPERLGHVLRRTDIQAGLDREDHAGLELPPLALLHVVTGVVHVEAEPVARAVHVELLVRV